MSVISAEGNSLNVAIACGGTGGHLFPGLAVADCLVSRGAVVTLMISAKEIDQLAAKTAGPMNFLTLPAIGLTRGNLGGFVRGLRQSYQVARASFHQAAPQAVLAMGGFTSAPPVLAGKHFGARTFIHESNAVPGRANRWLSRVVDQAFLGFPSARARLHTRRVTVTGTPVRSKFRPLNPAACRSALGLDPARPVALVMGGSQGARGINELVRGALPLLAGLGPDWQWFHLSGGADLETVRQAYRAYGLTARVHSFLAEMELVLGAATAAISRAGASSLAELAAMRVPALLVPFPAATDNHQWHNARALEQTGAAKLLEQATAGPEELARLFGELMREEVLRQRMQLALAGWHKPEAAQLIAQAILEIARSSSPPRSTAAEDGANSSTSGRLCSLKAALRLCAPWAKAPGAGGRSGA